LPPESMSAAKWGANRRAILIRRTILSIPCRIRCQSLANSTLPRLDGEAGGPRPKVRDMEDERCPPCRGEFIANDDSVLEMWDTCACSWEGGENAGLLPSKRTGDVGSSTSGAVANTEKSTHIDIDVDIDADMGG
jgi:hypothetical protein